jgi:RNA polymerase sigma-70 factor (ECF subfamily)
VPSSTFRSLEVLVARARNGSRSALGHLLAWYRPRLQKRARFGLPRNLARKQDASDIAQECQLYAAQEISQFRGQSPGEFSAWLRGILDRRVARAMRFWRATPRRESREQPLPSVGLAQQALAGPSVSPLDDLCSAEDRDRVARALGWCRPEDRLIITMRHLEDRSHEEIAAALAITTEAARQRYCRALGRAREAARLLALLDEHRVPGRQQEVVLLHRIQGLGPVEIVERLALTENLVKVWINEVKRILEPVGTPRP